MFWKRGNERGKKFVKISILVGERSFDLLPKFNDQKIRKEKINKIVFNSLDEQVKSSSAKEFSVFRFMHSL